jgi:dihydroflavonol-4-reductase
MSKILVTGANSFLGGNVVLELLGRGYRVRGLMRKSALMPVSHENLEKFHGHITRSRDVMRAAEGCDILIHIAAATDPSLPESDYEAVNVAGTENVIKAALFHKAGKVIYISTANAYGHGTKERPGDETIPVRPPFSRSGYARSKLRAQDLVLQAFRSSATRVTVVNPTFMIGPNDWKISSNRIILRALGKRMVLIPPGGKNFVHVKDVAVATCNAIDMGKEGECYLLAGENLSYREFYMKMAAVTGKKPLLINIPRGLLWLAGITGSLLRLAGLRSDIRLVNMQMISTGNYYHPGKAIRDLKLPQTPVEKAIEDAISWFSHSAHEAPRAERTTSWPAAPQY